MRPMLHFTRKGNLFSQEYCSDNSYLKSDNEDTDHISERESHQLNLCKKIPVKETTSLNLTKHENGKKMINEYIKVRRISRGSYGKVAMYRNIKDGTPYAIKTICKSRLKKVRVTRRETAMENILREVSIMKMLDHPNIVNLIEVIDDQKADHLYMVLEYIEGNPISNIRRMTTRIGETTARSYFKDIISGLIYLHSHNIIHGDIKPENLLLTSSGTVKIGDFSFSYAFEDENDKLSRCPGTPAFTPPECCLDTVYGGKAADTWAAGVTLYYLVVGSFPFLADSIAETYDKIVNSPLSLPEELNPELNDLLQGLLCKDPMHRITLDDAAEHPWVVKEGDRVSIESSCSCRLLRSL
ncbi:Protein kinase [Melia azedarach]|uniref:Protein kinase n=1 Tax=Melia azedarach TaxID=155640 RepID=A0ACC1YJW7_MELAZ|nr:Protein kinase [Melia azedarach]